MRAGPAFVVTLSASLLACRERTSPEPIKPEPSVATTKSEPKSEPKGEQPDPKPTKKRKRTAAKAADKSWEHPQAATITPLNPRDAKGREILVDENDVCYVALPKKDQPPNLPPGFVSMERFPLDCPPEMDDPAWDDCLYATMYAAGHPTDCQCRSMGGNPPPPPLQVKCPAKK